MTGAHTAVGYGASATDASLRAFVRRVAFAAVLFAQVALGIAQSPPPLDTFLTQLQRASQSDDREAVAAMIRYPITISIEGLRVPFADAASLVARYEAIFNPALRQSIERASVRPRADRKEVAMTPKGYVVGENDLVIAPVNGQLRITSISVPLFESITGAPPQHEPRRIAIRVGARPTQVSGLLARGTTDVFLLYLPKGQLAAVRLERVPAGVATIRVVHARTGEPLGARASTDARFVSGRPAEGADYRIEVRRVGDADDAHVPYILSLTLR